MPESLQVCTSPTPLPRVPINHGGAGHLTVPPPLPRRPSTQNNNNPPRVRASLPVPLSRSPFHSPVRANSLPHAPKVPPRERKPKNVKTHHQQNKLILNKHAATKTHNQLLPKSSKLPTQNAQKSSKNSENDKTKNTQDTQTTNLSDEMIQMISERERVMFDYHATTPDKNIPKNSKPGTNSKNVEFPKSEKLSSKTEKERCFSSPEPVKPTNLTSEHTTMEQIYCQNCHMLLEKIADTQESTVSTNCCGWFILLRKFVSKRWRSSRRNRYSARIDDTLCKEFNSASFEESFCVCREMEGKLVEKKVL